MRNHPAADVGSLDLAQLESKRRRDVSLLHLGLADVKLARLTVVVSELFSADAKLRTFLGGGEGMKTSLG